MSWLSWLSPLILLMIIPIFLLLKQKKIEKSCNPPGPPGLPFIGNLHQFDSAKPHEYFRKLSNKYGPLFSLRFGSVPVLVISSSEMAKEALKTHDHIFSGRPSVLGQQKLSYNGLDVAFSPYGEYWKETRKICVLHLFSLRRVQSFRPILEDEIFLLTNKIYNLSSSSQVINLSSLAISLTSTIICRIAFGKKCDEHETGRFDQIMKESQAMLAGFFVSDYLPSLSWIDKLSGMAARLDKNFEDLDLFFQELIEQHLNPNRPDTIMKDDVLDLLIQMKEQKSSAIDLTWDNVKALLTDIFLAGTTTTATTIVWAMTALIKTPSALKRVQDEIRVLIGQKGQIVEEIIQELPYLDAVIKETLRLYPPAPVLVPRETTESCNIGSYEIDAKTLVFINAWAIARDPGIWENPNDFVPERFLNNNIDVKGNDFEVIPFGAGRRGCPGIFLGLSTVKLALANLLHFFDWELPYGMKIEDIDTEVLPGITMQKRNALCLVAKKYP